MDAKQTSDIEHWRAFVRAIGKPGAVVQVDVPHKLECGNTVWDGHAFGASTKFIGERIALLDALDALTTQLTAEDIAEATAEIKGILSAQAQK